MNLRLPFKVICIDDTNKPDGIPTSKWVELGDVYTVIEISKMLIQEGMLGFKLEEKNIDDCFPYQFFAANRFAILIDDDMLIEMELQRLLEEAIKEYGEEKILYN